MTAFAGCKFCCGHGCLACDGERAKATAKPIEPAFVARKGNEHDMELLARAIGADALEQAFGPDGGGADERKGETKCQQ